MAPSETTPVDDPSQDIVVIGHRLPKEEPAKPTTAPALPAPAAAKPAPTAAKPTLPAGWPRTAVNTPPRPPMLMIPNAAKPVPSFAGKPLPTLPIPAWAKRPQGVLWSTIVMKAITDLGPDLIATNLADTADFCPKYNGLAKVERAKVWLTLIAAISLFESSFDPVESFREAFMNSARVYVVSRGLLQISSESANQYGCGITKEADLEDPETNLRCGVRILNRLVGADHRLRGNSTVGSNLVWHGAARYWSVLRGNKKDATIRANTRSMAQCAI